MSVAHTSKMAYTKIYDQLGEKQTLVFNALKELGVASNEMIADYLNWPINRVTGRVTELKKFGMVDVQGIGVNKSGHSAKLWTPCDINDHKLLDMAHDCE